MTLLYSLHKKVNSRSPNSFISQIPRIHRTADGLIDYKYPDSLLWLNLRQHSGPYGLACITRRINPIVVTASEHGAVELIQIAQIHVSIQADEVAQLTCVADLDIMIGFCLRADRERCKQQHGGVICTSHYQDFLLITRC